MNLPEAINHLDIAFGDGYAIEHPEQVIEYIKITGSRSNSTPN